MILLIGPVLYRSLLFLNIYILKIQNMIRIYLYFKSYKLFFSGAAMFTTAASLYELFIYLETSINKISNVPDISFELRKPNHVYLISLPGFFKYQ